MWCRCFVFIIRYGISNRLSGIDLVFFALFGSNQTLRDGHFCLFATWTLRLRPVQLDVACIESIFVVTRRDYSLDFKNNYRILLPELLEKALYI